jgi:hypothetical protein
VRRHLNSHSILSSTELEAEHIWRTVQWKDLGVADPLIGTPTSEKAFFISRPVYSGMHASADIEKSISPNQRIDGKRIAPFIEMESCTLEKRGGRWQLIECKMKFIT